MVRRGELVISVTQSGEVQSGSNKDIKCLVEGGSTILWIVEDGSQVKQGDELVRLDASKIEDGISQQKIAYEKARAAHIQAESDRVVAELAVTEYLEGTFRAALQLAQSNIAIAEENLRSANNRLEYTERMFRKGYVGAVERDAQRFAVEHAALELDLKRTEEDVLSRFTKPKTLEELRSKFKAADAKMLSEAAALDLEATRLARLEAQKDGCVIRAPADGMAIYPQVPRWSQQPEVRREPSYVKIRR
jgi:multidrug efflux pump subunit AcrA (membrane-fusion protein)